MKKIYLSIAGLALCVGAVAQTALKMPVARTHKAILTPGIKTPAKGIKNVAKTQAAGPFALQIDPIEEIMTQKGLDLTGANPVEDNFLASVFQDSTVSIASSDGDIIPNSDIILGTTFDPKSVFLQSSFEPIVSKMDSYNIDSIFVRVSYVKKTAAVDTVYAWLVWGDSTNTNVYTKMNASNAWVSPISTWKKSIIGPKIAGFTTADGNKIKAAAPATNQMLVKYVLQPEDSVTLYGRSRYISIPFTGNSATGVSIPAGNIVSCFYTFVPGGTNTLNQPMYSFTNAIVPTINGFCGIVWGQTAPINSAADFQPNEVDAASWNMGMQYDQSARYAQYNATFNGHAIGKPFSAPSIYYSITGNSTVGVNELDKKGFVLGQNTPNPYKGESKVSYMLSKNASSAVFTITDVMGRIVSSENVNANQGTHSVKLGALTSGIYYYSLNVDGNISTNKMIVE